MWVTVSDRDENEWQALAVTLNPTPLHPYPEGSASHERPVPRPSCLKRTDYTGWPRQDNIFMTHWIYFLRWPGRLRPLLIILTYALCAGIRDIASSLWVLFVLKTVKPPIGPYNSMWEEKEVTSTFWHIIHMLWRKSWVIVIFIIIQCKNHISGNTSL